MDLRERVVKAKGTDRATRLPSVLRWPVAGCGRFWIRARTTGSVAPLPRGGNRARKVDAQGEAQIRQWVDEQPDLTIDELRERYLAERQVAVSEPAMRRTVNRMGLSRKKDALCDGTRERTGPLRAQRVRSASAWVAWSPSDLLRRKRRELVDDARLRASANTRARLRLGSQELGATSP